MRRIGRRHCLQNVRFSSSVPASRAVFASSSSSDLRPRIAAQEAFDVCASALPRPPNFALVNVSVDHADMLEAPSVIWASLMHVAQENGFGSPTMIAQVVRQQRFGGANFLEVMTGNIPGLRSQCYTFDSLPASMDDDTFLNVSLVDWQLANGHLPDVNRRLAQISGLSLAPTVGAVLPPAAGSSDAGPEDLPVSTFFLNDNIFQGSASGISLSSSAMERTQLLSSRPAAPLLEPKAVVGTFDAVRSEWTIRTIGGQRATDVVRDLYENKLKDWRESKVFASIELGDGILLPMPFRGNPISGDLVVSVPPALPSGCTNFDTVSFVCDSPLHDKEAVAAQLIATHDTLTNENRHAANEKIAVAREQSREVPVADSAVLHWSSFTFYDVFEGNENGLSLRPDGLPTSEVHAPSIARRCLPAEIPCAGIHCGAQIMPLSSPGNATGTDKISAIAARSSVHALLQSKRN